MSKQVMSNKVMSNHVSRFFIRPVLVVGVLALLVSACGGGDDKKPTTTTMKATTTTTVPPVAALTGESLTDEGLRTRPALVVKIDNTPKALGKQAGLNAADLVYVEQVEGGATRLAAVFQSTNAEAVGPVRSARTSDYDIVKNLNRPLFAYSGANAGVDAGINASPLVNVGVSKKQNAYSKRGSGVLRFFASTEALYDGEEGSAPGPLFTYRAKDAAVTSASAEAAEGVNISYGGSSNTTINWALDPNGWARTQSGKPHVDDTGARVTPANVIVQFVEYRSSGYVDVTGSPSPEAVLVGEGEVWVFSGAKLVRGRWSRPNPESVTTMTDAAGQPITLAIGRTWVELAPVASAAAILAPVPAPPVTTTPAKAPVTTKVPTTKKP